MGRLTHDNADAKVTAAAQESFFLTRLRFQASKLSGHAGVTGYVNCGSLPWEKVHLSSMSYYSQYCSDIQTSTAGPAVDNSLNPSSVVQDL